jgi:hypothetical protein
MYGIPTKWRPGGIRPPDISGASLGLERTKAFRDNTRMTSLPKYASHSQIDGWEFAGDMHILQRPFEATLGCPFKAWFELRLALAWSVGTCLHVLR